MPAGGSKVHLSLDRAYVETLLHDLARYVLERELPADIHLKVRIERWLPFHGQPLVMTTITDWRADPPVSETFVWPITQLIEERETHAAGVADPRDDLSQ